MQRGQAIPLFFINSSKGQSVGGLTGPRSMYRPEEGGPIAELSATNNSIAIQM